jgi:hypothetical protein
LLKTAINGTLKLPRTGPKKRCSEAFVRRYRWFRSTAFNPFQRKLTGDVGPRNINSPIGT